MDIRTLLQEEHSKAQASIICAGVISGHLNIAVLFDLLISGDMRMRQRASLPIEMIAKSAEYLIYPHLESLIEVLHRENIHDSLPRNILRIWQHMSFTEELIGEIYDISFAYLSNPNNAIAIRVFAMSTCSKIADQYPELSQELILTIEEQYPHASTGFRNRARKELQKLKQLKN